MNRNVSLKGLKLHSVTQRSYVVTSNGDVVDEKLKNSDASEFVVDVVVDNDVELSDDDDDCK